jgi:hypothetical protein
MPIPRRRTLSTIPSGPSGDSLTPPVVQPASPDADPWSIATAAISASSADPARIDDAVGPPGDAVVREMGGLAVWLKIVVGCHVS